MQASHTDYGLPPVDVHLPRFDCRTLTLVYVLCDPAHSLPYTKAKRQTQHNPRHYTLAPVSSDVDGMAGLLSDQDAFGFPDYNESTPLLPYESVVACSLLRCNLGTSQLHYEREEEATYIIRSNRISLYPIGL